MANQNERASYEEEERNLGRESPCRIGGDPSEEGRDAMRNIVERNAAARAPTVYGKVRRDHLEEIESLRRQLRRVSERNHAAFDQGFKAAAKMVEAGTTLEQLLEASGVVSAEWEDTSPIEMLPLFEDEEENTNVDIIPLPSLPSL